MKPLPCGSAADIYEELYQRRDTLSDSHADLVVAGLRGTLENLACRAQRLQRYDEAERLFRRVMEVGACDALPCNVPIFAEGLVRQGKHAEAELLLRRAIAERQGAHPVTRGSWANCMRVLANLYAERDEHEAAEQLYREAIAGSEDGGRATAWALAASLEAYAALCRKAGREAEAAQLEARARQVRDEFLPTSKSL